MEVGRSGEGRVVVLREGYSATPGLDQSWSKWERCPVRTHMRTSQTSYDASCNSLCHTIVPLLQLGCLAIETTEHLHSDRRALPRSHVRVPRLTALLRWSVRCFGITDDMARQAAKTATVARRTTQTLNNAVLSGYRKC